MAGTLIFVDGLGNQVTRVLAKPFKVGRGADCDVKLPPPADEEVCRIVELGGRWQVEDFGARRTFVNEAPVLLGRPRPLASGDRIRVGDGRAIWFDAEYRDQATVDEELARLRAEVTRLEEALRAARLRVGDADDRAATADAEAIRWRKRAEELDQSLGGAVDDLAAVRNQHSELRGAHDSLARDFDAQGDKLARFEMQIAAHDAELRRAQGEADTWRERAHAVEADLAIATERATAARQDVARMREELERRDGEIWELKAVIGEQQQKLRELEAVVGSKP